MKTHQLLFLIFSISFFSTSFGQIKLETQNIDSRLYFSEGENQPLVVGLGGAEGGNAWDSDHWKETRDQFLEKGYAFLALGYFGSPDTPAFLEKIAIEDVYNAIKVASQQENIDSTRIAIVGGSRGGDLALLLGSYYPDINCIVALVPSHAAFPGHTMHFTTSAWTYNNNELPFIPVNEEAIPFLMKRDLRGAFTTMLKDSVAEKNSLIKVENIKAPILFLSATKDEFAPTTEMCEKMMQRLEEHNFPYVYEHQAIEGGHAEPLKHFDLVFSFLEKNYPVQK